MNSNSKQEENIRIDNWFKGFGYFEADYYHDDGDDRVYFFRIVMEYPDKSSVVVEDLGKMTWKCASEELQKHIQLRNIEMEDQWPVDYLRFPHSQRNPSALPLMYNTKDGKYIIRLVEYHRSM